MYSKSIRVHHLSPQGINYKHSLSLCWKWTVEQNKKQFTLREFYLDQLLILDGCHDYYIKINQQISKTASEFTSELHYIVNATLSTSCVASTRFLLTTPWQIGEKVNDS